MSDDEIEEFIELLREDGRMFRINEDEAYTGDGDYPDMTDCIPLHAVEEAIRAHFTPSSGDPA